METTIVCPFCPLACDDVRVVAPNAPHEPPRIQTDCQLATKRFHTALQPAPPRIGHHTASLDDIRQHLQSCFRQAKRVVVHTGGVDLGTAKALEGLTATGAILWTLDQSPLTQSWQRTASRDGIISATLADVREHADLLWLIGNVESGAPRILDILTANRPAPRVIQSPGPLALDTLASLSLFTRPSNATSRSASEPRDPKLAELSQAIESSKYVAVVVADDAFTAQHADAALSLLVQWTWSLNSERRAVAMHLDDTATASTVYRWRTNRSLPRATDIASLEGDLCIRIGDNSTVESTVDSTVDIAIGTSDPGFARAQVFVPCSLPGVHHAGAKIRGDGTVTMPLGQITSCELPTAIAWLELLAKN